MSILTAARGSFARVNNLFVDREIYLRARGQVRFLRVARAAQLRAAALLLLVLGGLAALTLAGVLGRMEAAATAARLDRAQAASARDGAAVARYRDGAAATVRDLAERQRLIEALVTERLGPAPVASPAAKTISTALPTAAQLHALGQQQERFARALAARFEARTERTAQALRRLGLRPDAMIAGARTAAGGPLAPWPGRGATLPPPIRQLADAIARWTLLEDNLATVPSGRPTEATMVTSSYGVRADPFTGVAAFHAGLDFVGRYGQPIVAAAAGRVAFVGDRAGYGRVVEIEHGNGLLTRYAHLSRVDVAAGGRVTRGQQVARMGSTGRSTGTHLHFEVRVNGAAVNPRRFLDASQEIGDVRQVQRRDAAARDRG